MQAHQAHQLIVDYVDGWKESDPQKIVNTLATDCVVIESHGPTYRGIRTVERWAQTWFAEGNRVERWEITSFLYNGETAAFEWAFECTAGGQYYQIDGASIVAFAGEHITAIREYRRTASPYDWTGITKQ